VALVLLLSIGVLAACGCGSGGRDGSTTIAVPGDAQAHQTTSCHPDQLSLKLTASQSTGGELIGIDLHGKAAPACALDSTIELAIKRPGGAEADVEGNPFSIPVRQMVNPGTDIRAIWHWLNWCGPNEAVVLTASFAGKDARRPAPRPLPFCQSRTYDIATKQFTTPSPHPPSTLTLIKRPRHAYFPS
jgi:hypothetical protein